MDKVLPRECALIAKYLVTGANGFIGKSLCKEMTRKGYAVVGGSRIDSLQIAGVESQLVGDIEGATDWLEALSGVSVVVHLAARVHLMDDKVPNPLAEFRKVNVEGTLNLARQAAVVGIKRFVFVSTIKVNGEATILDKPFTADDKANPQDAYGLSKFEAERGLMQIAQQTGMEVVIIRPPLVYGAGVKANFAGMILAVKRGIPLPLGAIYNKRSFVYIGNLVSLIMCCINHPAAVNQVFLVSDGHDLSSTELLQGCAQALGVKPRLMPVSQKLVEACGILLGKRLLAQRLCGNLQVDITKTRELLGWEPSFTVAQGLNATVLI